MNTATPASDQRVEQTGQEATYAEATQSADNSGCKRAALWGCGIAAVLGLIAAAIIGVAGVMIYREATVDYPPILDLDQAYAPPSEEQKLWALATGAILNQTNHKRHDILGGEVRTDESEAAMRESLAQWWGIRSRDDLFNDLLWIRRGGHRRQFDAMTRQLLKASPEQLQEVRKLRDSDPDYHRKVQIVNSYGKHYGMKSIAAWDFDRYVCLCGWGYVAGYLSEDEAWRLIMPAARLLQNTFDSWRDLGMNHVTGRQFWSLRHTERSGHRVQGAYDYLLMSDPNSPWRTIPWDLDLRPQETEE